jgi:phage terminase Nu1 subunit (DNA packaging protein)
VASDDAFRAAHYLEAQKQHKRDVAANKAEKDLCESQEAAKGVLTMEKEAKDFSLKDWETVIRIGVKLKD